MNIGILAVDSNYPNLALMKISGYHKLKGDQVEWYNPFNHYDKVYMAKIFSFTEDYQQWITNADHIEKGGTGYDISKVLPSEIDCMVPDYSLYNLDDKTAYGFLTRGCPNKCKWCIVPQLIDSAIIGSVEIVDCVQNHPSIWAEKTDTDNKGYYKNPIYNWVLTNPILFNKPIENVKGKLSFWEYPGINEVKIECPECGSIEIAIEDYTTAPFPTFLHSCNNCGYVIMESEWNVIEELNESAI